MQISLFSSTAISQSTYMTRQERLEQRNKTIRASYVKLYAQGFRAEVILEKLANQYVLSEETVYRIVAQSGHYKEPATTV